MIHREHLWGDGRVFLRHRRWWIAYYVRNQERRESSYSEDRDAAEVLLRRRVDQAKAIRAQNADRLAEEEWSRARLYEEEKPR